MVGTYLIKGSPQVPAGVHMDLLDAFSPLEEAVAGDLELAHMLPLLSQLLPQAAHLLLQAAGRQRRDRSLLIQAWVSCAASRTCASLAALMLKMLQLGQLAMRW